MNSREKQIIEGLIKKDGRCITLLLGDVMNIGRAGSSENVRNGYVKAVRNAVRKWFNPTDNKYKNIVEGFEDIYNSFYSLFSMYLLSIKEETLLKIENLESWLFITADNFIKKNRKEIDEHIGVYSEDGFDERVDSFDVEIEEQPTTYDWARKQVSGYIDKISNVYYRDLIYAIKLEGVDRDVLAEEYNKSVDDINRDYKRAWDQLISVSLVDIKYRSRQLFKRYEADLTDQQATVLRMFFFNNYDMDDLAREFNINGNSLKTEIVKAYNALLKIAKREMKLDEKEERATLREKKCDKTIKLMV